MRRACVIALLAIWLTGCGDAQLADVKSRALKLLEENPELADDQIKSLDVKRNGSDAHGDKYTGMLKVIRNGEVVKYSLEITVNDHIDRPNGGTGEGEATKELYMSMKPADT